MMRQLVIVGAGGFGAEVSWICERAGFEVIGFCDDAPEKGAGMQGRYRLLGPIEVAARSLPHGVGFHVAIGTNRVRLELARRALAAGWQAVTLIDPTATVAPDLVLGAGSLVGLGVVVSCRTQIGEHVIINHHVSVGHDCQIESGAQLCPGVRLSGGCHVGSGGLLGSNAVVLPGISLGEWSTLGAGSVALRDIAAGASQVRIR